MEETISFKTGLLELEGLLGLPSKPAGGVVLCHPHPLMGGEMHNPLIRVMANTLRSAGLATLRFNFRGVGRSQGTYGGGNREVEDVSAAVTFLAGRLDHGARIGLCGYSFGSMVSLRAGAADSRVSAIAGIAPLVDPINVLAGWKGAKFFVIGTNDEWIDPLGLVRVVGAMPDPKEIRLVDGAGHLFLGREKEVSEMVAGFFLAYLSK